MSKLKYLAGAAIFATALGVINSNGASAYEFEDPTIDIERTITNLQTRGNVTFSYSLTADAGNPSIIDTSGFTESCTVDADPVNGVETSEDCGFDLSSYLNFNSANYGRYKFILSESDSTDGDRYPVDTNTYTIYMNYYGHQSDNDGDPIPGTGPYIEITSIRYNDSQKVGGDPLVPVFTSAANLDPAYIEIDAAVNGTFANTDDEFSFLVELGGRNGSSDYTIYKNSVDNPSTWTPTGNCSYTAEDKSACTFTLKHGETARVGYDTTNGGQINPGYVYTVEETSHTGYTVAIDGVDDEDAKTNPTATLEPSDGNNLNHVSFVNKSGIEPADSKAFFNILPFVILGAAAIISIAAARKNKHTR